MIYMLMIYAFNILLCIFATSAINFEKIIRKNKGLETQLLAMIVSLVLAYLLTNFILDFIEWSKVI